MELKKKKGKIVTVTSTKGGVGKTIAVLTLAQAYTLMEKHVLIIDMDFYSGDIAVAVNSSNDRTIFNLVEDFTNNRYEKTEDYIYQCNSFISIIASPKDPRLANKIDAKFLPIILENVVYKYDVVLIDTSHVLTKNNIVAIDNSDKILYILTNDSFDLKNSKSFMSVIKDTGMDNVVVLLNESLNHEKGYFSMYDIRNIIGHNIDYVLSNNFYIKNIDKYIMEGTILNACSSLGLFNGKNGKEFLKLPQLLIEDKEEKL